MTTVKQLKEYLETLPDDATVEVLKVYEVNYESYAKFVPLDLKVGVYYSEHSKYLELGEE